MRALATTAALLLAVAAHAERILLIPVDSRPAASQFAQMIGKIDGVKVEVPPDEYLGRFTDPGYPDQLVQWLLKQDYRDVKAIIVSTDMMSYGGLIESRVNSVSSDEAIARIRTLMAVRKAHPKVTIYAFSSVMRISPTSLKGNASYRSELQQYVAYRERAARLKDPVTWQTKMANLLAKIPAGEVGKYDATRKRNHEVQKALIKMTQGKLFDYLMIGQDDAQPYGPHVPETLALRNVVEKIHVQGKVFFCEGIDQHANILVSRAMLRNSGWIPKVRVVYSDEEGKKMFASYESKPISQSLSDQIYASGARPATATGPFDYTLYVNTPNRQEGPFRQFVSRLKSDLDTGKPISIADINLGKTGTGDPELIDALWENQRMTKLLSYAGWNTAGNTMGTSIPAANMALLANRQGNEPLQMEVARREFLLHRFANDYFFHRVTRPKAYQMLDALGGSIRDEVYGESYRRADDLVREDLAARVRLLFQAQFVGKPFYAGTQEYTLTDLRDLKVSLPWPRAYEVRLEFNLLAAPVSANATTGGPRIEP